MYRLITLFFCCAVFSMGCRKGDERNYSAARFEAQLRQASQKANHLMQNKRIRMGQVGEMMTIDNSGSLLTEVEAREITQPLIDPSASFMQSHYAINIYEYLPAGSPKIAQIGALALRLKQFEEEGKAIDTNLVDLWFLPQAEMISQANGELLTNAVNPSIFDCAMDALGIPAGLIMGATKNYSRAALIKAAKKLATRTLGWVGAGIAIYEFGDCMNWW